jgi:hypothetical protein
MPRMSTKPNKPCQFDGCQCTDFAVRGEKYCPRHRRVMLARMEESGYLTPLPDDTQAGTRRIGFDGRWDDIPALEQGKLT